jgi:hypothetical protein
MGTVEAEQQGVGTEKYLDLYLHSPNIIGVIIATEIILPSHFYGDVEFCSDNNFCNRESRKGWVSRVTGLMTRV